MSRRKIKGTVFIFSRFNASLTMMSLLGYNSAIELFHKVSLSCREILAMAFQRSLRLHKEVGIRVYGGI